MNTTGYQKDRRLPSLELKPLRVPMKFPLCSPSVRLVYSYLPLADLASIYMTCPEISGHPIKLHLIANNVKTIWLKCLNCSLNVLQRQISWIFCKETFFFQVKDFRLLSNCCHVKKAITLIKRILLIWLSQTNF